MEKKFNWLGWLLILIFAILDTLLFIVGILVWNNSYNSQDLSVFIVSSSLVFLVVGAALMPRWYHWGLGKLLPIQKCTATVFHRETVVRHTQDATGPELTISAKFITFVLTNSNRIVFKVPVEKYYTILMGESGLLTYKQQGKHTYFISFERNKRF